MTPTESQVYNNLQYLTYGLCPILHKNLQNVRNSLDLNKTSCLNGVHLNTVQINKD